MEKGFMEGEVTGFYGDTTKTALKAYQTSAGLPSTGFLYELTRIKIESETCR
jgi:peptidoglycan hydrolase-like protein with peptidoglycan-binding domain